MNTECGPTVYSAKGDGDPIECGHVDAAPAAASSVSQIPQWVQGNDGAGSPEAKC